MCGRFVIEITPSQMIDFIRNHYDVLNLNTNDLKLPKYNISPSEQVISMISDGKNHRLGTLKWGFTPSYINEKQTTYHMINARAETLHQKKTFSNSFKHKRCIIFASGFYEWKKEENIKKPMYIYLKDTPIFAFAGLYDTSQDKEGKRIHQATIITTKANEFMQDIHDRMPVILNRNQQDQWLNPNITDYKTLVQLLSPIENHLMQAHEVSTYVNKTSNDSSLCIKKV